MGIGKTLSSEDAGTAASVSPTEIRARLASVVPTTPSIASSLNHLPSIFHHGLVFSIPVPNVLPSDNETLWSTQVPISWTRLISGFAKVCLDGFSSSTASSRIGAKAMMLLCQKTDLILGRSDSGR